MAVHPPGPAPFEPDSPEASGIQPSPNHGERRDGRRPDMLVLHYTGMPSATEALARLCDPAAEVSAHYLVFEDGRVLQLVPEALRAWHAGAGAWAGERDVNSASIGVEVVNPGHDGGLPPYPDVQIEAVIRLARDIVGRWAIPPDRVLAHSDIAPGRKEDPGERFPWDRLARAGVGLWVEPAPVQAAATLAPGSAGPNVESLQALLRDHGYDLARTGVYDPETVAVVTAFQRHFRPSQVDGIADGSTASTLRALRAALASTAAEQP